MYVCMFVCMYVCINVSTTIQLCSGSFNSGSRVLFEDKKPICEDCRNKSTITPIRASTCKSCNKEITGRSVIAMDRDWHVECFACKYCKVPLSGEYMIKDDFPYCESDYLNLFGQKCKICEDFIVGRVLQAGGVSYHNACLTCQVCGKGFAEGHEIFTQDGVFWHTECEQYLEDTEYFDEEDEPGVGLSSAAEKLGDNLADLTVKDNSAY